MQNKEEKYQSLTTERDTEATGIDGMIENGTEVREEIRREARRDMIGTEQGHLERNPVIIHTGLLEILRETNGGDEMMKAENELEVRLQNFYALPTAITGNGSLFLSVVYILD